MNWPISAFCLFFIWSNQNEPKEDVLDKTQQREKMLLDYDIEQLIKNEPCIYWGYRKSCLDKSSYWNMLVVTALVLKSCAAILEEVG